MNKKQVLINLSNRHIHLAQEDVDVLFGKNYQLNHLKDLLQTGQFACRETVTLIGSKGNLEKVRVLGPVRAKTQAEILRSDVYAYCGVTPPTCESGKLEGSAPLVIQGPAGRVEKAEGLIIAKRHIHMDPISAQEFGVKDNQIVALKCGIKGREVIFNDIVIRVNPSFKLECHLDFDEGNACGIGNDSLGTIYP